MNEKNREKMGDLKIFDDSRHFICLNVL